MSSDQALEIVEIATGEVVHVIPCPGETPGTGAWRRLKMGVLNNIGRFECQLSRGGEDEVDDRLDLRRYFLRDRLPATEPSGSYADAHTYDVAGESRLCSRRVNYRGAAESVELDYACPYCMREADGSVDGRTGEQG